MKNYKYNYKGKEYVFSADDSEQKALETISKITSNTPDQIILSYVQKYKSNDVHSAVILGLQEDCKMIECVNKYNNITPNLNYKQVSNNLDKLTKNLSLSQEDIDNFFNVR